MNVGVVEDIKRKLLLIPSAYNWKVMGDVEGFIDCYRNRFDVYVISNRFEEECVVENGVSYVNNEASLANYLIHTAEYIIDAGSINGYSKVSSSQKRISVWHGIPYKNMFTKLDAKYCRQALEYCRGVDLMVSPSPFYSQEFLRDSMLYTGSVLETGVARTDSLRLSQGRISQIKAELGIPPEKKVLLYAPTFRKKGSYNLPFDIKRLVDSLPSSEWVVLLKLHYLNNLSNPGQAAQYAIDCTNYSLVNNLLAISDALITDYSSLFFDYSLLDRPALFFQYDRADYASDRGFMFDLENYVESRYVVDDEDALMRLVKSLDEEGPNLSKVREFFYPHQIEDATDKLVGQLALNDSPRRTREIIFLVNHLNEIGGIHNFVMNLARLFKEKFESKIIVVGRTEFAIKNSEVNYFDPGDYVDIKLSLELNKNAVANILQSTDGYIIGCQFGAFMSMQDYMRGKKCVVMFHGDVKDIVNKTLYKTHLDTINSGLIRNYSKMLLLTESNMKLLSEHLCQDARKRLGYIENAFDFDDRRDYYKKNGEFVCVTRLDADKNPFDLIRLFSCEGLNPEFKVHVYGDGSLRRQFEEQIRENALEDRIILHGYCSDKEEIYKDKQGLVMVGLSEGFPYVILEAYKYGIPVYSYGSFTAVYELIDDDIGRIIPVGDVEQFARALNENLEVRGDSFDAYIDRFSNGKILGKWLQLFYELETQQMKEGGQEVPLFESSRLSTGKNKGKTTLLKRFLRRYKKKLLADNVEKKMSDRYINLVNFRYKVSNIGKAKRRPKVSIIVPFYNNGNTLDGTLSSIRLCGYSNYEVLVINDGSAEDPRLICSRYKHVEYYYKENEGPGLTRNFGMDHATGKYIFFLDSDDEICPGALDFMVDYAEIEDLSVVNALCRRVYYNTGMTSFWYKDLYRKKTVNSFDDRAKLFYDTISTSKLYNLCDLREANIRFERGLYEDIQFMGRVYSAFPRIGCIPNLAYTWYVYEKDSSITTTIAIRNYKERLRSYSAVVELATEQHKIQWMKGFLTTQIYDFVNNFNLLNDEEKRILFDDTRRMLLKYEKYIYKRLVYRLDKQTIAEYLIDDDYESFAAAATCVSAEHLREVASLRGYV